LFPCLDGVASKLSLWWFSFGCCEVVWHKVETKWNIHLKLLYLLNSVSIFNFICTGVFYVTRRTKLDPTYIYFDLFSSSNLCVLTYNI
jgi:hypothetical protein